MTYVTYMNFITYLQNVTVCHAVGDPKAKKPLHVFQAGDPLMGPDGKIIRTSVCQEIEDSVKRASAIEEQLAKSKVIYHIL